MITTGRPEAATGRLDLLGTALPGRNGGNSGNGKRSKTVLTDAGPLDLDVSRDRDGSFEPQLVRKRQRRISGLDELVISLSAKGLTHGEIAAHLAEVYGAEVSKQTITTIADRVLDADERVAEPAPGPGVSGDLHRRRKRQDP
jgi:putative transposase